MEKYVNTARERVRTAFLGLGALARGHAARTALIPGGLFLLFMSLAAFAAVDGPREAPAFVPPVIPAFAPLEPYQELPTAIMAERGPPRGEYRVALNRNEYRAFVRPARPKIPVNPGPNANLSRLFSQAAEEYGLPADLLSAISQEESSWNPYALNIEGRSYFPVDKAEAARLLVGHADDVYDVGLMQINSYWIRKYHLNPVKLLDSETNIRFGAWILRGCFEAYGLSWRAVGAYHTGHPDRRPERTMNYASRVIQRYEDLAAVQ